MLLGVLCAQPAVAQLLDWDVEAWPPGSTAETFSVGGDNVSLTFGGDLSALRALSGTASPHINSSLTGGLNPVENGLYVRTNHPSNGLDYITLTIDFAHTGGVYGVSFSILDVDLRNTNHIDQLQFTATASGLPVNPSSVITAACNSFDTVNTVTGTCSSSSTSSTGNATVTFDQTGISQIQIVYRNTSPLSNPGVQEISIHDLAFSTQLELVKRAFQSDGTPITDSSTLPTGVPVKFMLYVNNPGPLLSNVSLRDVLDPLFQYSSGGLRFDNSVASCAASTCTPGEEDTIFAAVDSGTVGTEGTGDDIVSVSGATIDVGNQNATNAKLQIPASSVWALLITVTLQ
ncbi:MAG: hypothetical protein GY716_03155 [bacterium]|nr:hypothetical protein [bacterium]